MKTISLITILCFGAVAGWAAPLKIELPPESPVLKPGPGAQIAQSQCLICHSSEYLSTQPILPRAYWKGAVEKMQKKFGAPIAAEQMDPLIEYLVRSYGVEQPR